MVYIMWLEELLLCSDSLMDPFGHMELEYEADEYDEYVRDIKKAIRIKKPLTEFVE